MQENKEFRFVLDLLLDADNSDYYLHPVVNQDKASSSKKLLKYRALTTFSVGN